MRGRVFNGLMLVAAALLALALFASIAMAQAEPAAVSRTSWLYDVWIVVQPIVTLLVSLAAPVIVAQIVVLLMKALNLMGVNSEAARVEVERKVREALHTAAMNALKYAVAKRVGPIGDMVTGAVPPDVLRDAVEYIRTKSPDAAADLDNPNLIEIILSKVPDVQATITAARGPTGITLPANAGGGANQDIR